MHYYSGRLDLNFVRLFKIHGNQLVRLNAFGCTVVWSTYCIVCEEVLCGVFKWGGGGVWRTA